MAGEDGTLTVDVRCGICGRHMKLLGHTRRDNMLLASYRCTAGHGAADVGVALTAEQYAYDFAGGVETINT